MAQLKPARGNAPPTGRFGVLLQRKSFMPDGSDAAKAKSSAAQTRARGAINAARDGQVDTKTNRVLGSRSNPNGIFG